MHRPNAHEFLQALLETLEDLPPDFIRRFEGDAEKDRRTDRKRSVSSSRKSPVTEKDPAARHARLPRGSRRDDRGFREGRQHGRLRGQRYGKSTIADALEWYFTGGIELLSHEGRQHAVAYVGGETDDVTSVEVFTNGTLGGKVAIPDERTPETFQVIRRETFLLRGRTLADFINKTKTEKWKALVEILGLDAIEGLREDLQRARNELRKLSKAAEDELRTYRRAVWRREPRTSARIRFWATSSRSARCSA